MEYSEQRRTKTLICKDIPHAHTRTAFEDNATFTSEMCSTCFDVTKAALKMRPRISFNYTMLPLPHDNVLFFFAPDYSLLHLYGIDFFSRQDKGATRKIREPFFWLCSADIPSAVAAARYILHYDAQY